MAGPFSIGSDRWPGLSKLIEEMGEVGQIAGKLLGTGGAIQHWDGSNLKDRLEEELADLSAAIGFVIAACELDEAAIERRCMLKLETFIQWHREGR